MKINFGDIIAALALLLSTYATWRTHSFKKKEEVFLDVQSKVSALILEKEKREAALASRAELGASFIAIGSKTRRLKVFNRGKAEARNVQIHFPEGNEVILESEIEDKFPMEVLEPGQAVELTAAVHWGTKRKHMIRLTWQDLDEQEQEKVVHVTL